MEEGHRVLLVEDELTLRRAMTRGIERLAGVSVVDAATVREAKSLLADERCELVLSDLDLPDGSGIEVASEVERLGLRIPVIFISAFVGRFRNRIPKRSDVEVYEKPISLEKLRNLVEDKLGLVGEPAVASPFGVADYVQLAGMGMHTVVVEVRSSAGSGEVLIRRGQLWSARDSRGTGLEAFRRLVLLRAAQVTCHTVDPSEVTERTIDGSAEAVLLDVARTFDEAENASDSRIPLDDGWGNLLSEHPPPPPAEAPPSLQAKELPGAGFDAAFERGVDALLVKDYPNALAAFRDADRFAPGDRRVVANLERLRALGFT